MSQKSPRIHDLDPSFPTQHTPHNFHASLLGGGNIETGVPLAAISRDLSIFATTMRPFFLPTLSILLALATTPLTVGTSMVGKLLHTTQFFFDIMQGHHNNGRGTKQGGLQVLGAGFPRTGTKSIEQALILLGHRVYDIRSVNENGHGDRWIQAAHDYSAYNDTTVLEGLVAEMEQRGYTATLDFPLFLFALPMAELRPEAKVLLSVRDSPDAWYRSFVYINRLMATYWSARPWVWMSPNFMELYPPIHKALLGIEQVELTVPRDMARPLPWYEKVHAFDENHVNFRRSEWVSAYKEHNNRIIDALPSNRVLEFNAKQGWEPWIDFFNITNVSELSEEFPYVNERRVLELGVQLLDVIAIGFPFFVGLALFLAFKILTVSRKAASTVTCCCQKKFI